jgi:hypothetical protein
MSLCRRFPKFLYHGFVLQDITMHDLLLSHEAGISRNGRLVSNLYDL